MKQCIEEQRANQYFDNELSTAERAVFGRHLSQCALCRKTLAELALLSRGLVQGTVCGPSPDSLLQAKAQVASIGAERTSRRTAHRLLAVACILFVTSLVLNVFVSNSHAPEGQLVANWERYALSSPTTEYEFEEPDSGENLALWMQQNLSSEESHE
jgi:anti-sigma factor RsiW